MADTITLSDLATAIINDKNIPTHSDIATIIPNQTSNSGKFLTTNGTVLSWANVDTLPNQASNSGKFLTTNGTTSNWSEISILPSQTSNEGKFLKTDGTNLSWANNETIYRRIDARSLSGSNLTVQETDGTTTTISANGILWGWRMYSMIIENTLVCKRDVEWIDPMALGWHNGCRGQYEEGNFAYKLVIGGHIIYQWVDSYQIRLNALYFHRFYNTRLDYDFGIYGSNDKIKWDLLRTFNLNSTDEFTDGKTDSTQELNGTSITFAGRTNTDEGIIVGQNGNYAANHVERYTFANENYYLFYMIKMIAPSNRVTIARNTRTSGDLNTQNEFEWG